jgi:hypothetical protein
MADFFDPFDAPATPAADFFDPFSAPGTSLQTPEAGADSSKQFYDDTALGEIGEGIVSGAIGIGEGVLGLGAMAVDVVADTNYGDQITQGAEALRDALGVDPEGFLGKGAEIVTQFVVPGLGAAAKVNSLAKAARAAKAAKAGPWAKAPGPMTKAERFSLAAKELAAAGAVDAVVSTDNTTTLGDWVEAGPTQTEDLIGLNGREKALARLGSRLKMGVESTALGGLVQGALVGGGRTLGQTRVAKNIAGAANRKIDEVGRSIDNLLIRRMTAVPGSADELGGFKKGLADAIAFSQYRGFLPEQVATRRLLMEGKVQSQIKRADRLLNSLETEIDSAIKAFPTGPGGNLDRVGIMNRIESYLTETDRAVKARVLKELPKNIRQNAIRMRKHVDELSEGVLNSNFLKQNNFVTRDGQNLNDLIEQNLNSYLRRRYRVFEDAKYTPTQDSIKVANDFFRSNRKAVERELTTLARNDPFGEAVTDDFLIRNGLNRVGTGPDMRIELGAKVTDETVDRAREAFLNRYSIRNREKLSGGRVARDRLETGLFMTREAVPKPLRQLLGEVDDPREAYLGTIADLAQFNAVDDYFGSVAKLAEGNSGLGKLFVNGNNLTPDQAKALKDRGYVKLGGEDGQSSMVGAVGKVPDEIDKMVGRAGWGSLDGYFVPAPIYKNLTNQVLAEDSFGAAITNATVGTFLKAKGISQYSKTVLSPITQVRNFTTAVAFATANGNIPVIGRGGSLIDSAQAIFANIRNKGSDKVFDDILDAQRRGVIGTNAELREIQDQLNKGLGLTAREPQNFAEAVAGRTGAVGEKIVSGVGKVTKPFEVLYQASDDFWKYFNYNAEQAQLRHALRGADDAAKIKYLTRNGTDVTPEMAEAIRKGDVDIDDLIKDRAAQIVRDTVPNYSKGASELVQLGRKLPVGNFITFPAEMFRTSFNIVKQGLDDMASEIPEVQARGQQRLLSFGFTTAVVPAAIAETAHQLSGVSREEMDAYQRSFAAPWEKGSILVPVERTEDGKIRYINLSTSNPYDIVSRFANRAINEAENAAAEGKDPGQALTSVMVGTLTELFAPFLSEAMLTEALVDISLRGGRTSTGAEIYNPQDSFGDKGSKMFLHVMETMLPNLVPINVSGGEIEPSRFARGVIGSLSPDLVDPKDKLGRERELTTEIFRQFTGISPMEFDPKKGLEFNAFRMQQAQTDAKRMFNRVTDDANATPETFLNAYVEANQAKLRVDRAYYRMIKDLETMGLPEDEIRQILKKNNVGGFGALMRGMFEPFSISERNYQEMQDAGTIDLFPQSEILDLRNSLLEVPLEAVPDIEAPSVEAPATEAPSFFDPFEAPSGGGSGSSSSQGAAPPPPAFDSMPAPSAPQLPTAPANRASLSPSLLGGDLASQMANMEIAQRLGG